MSPSELHFTTGRDLFLNRARNWLTGILAAAVLVGVYAVVDLHDRNIKLDRQVSSFLARGCPEYFDGLHFAFSAYEVVDVLRPRYARLACYYMKTVSS